MRFYFSPPPAFVAHPCLRSGHAQTIIPSFLPAPMALPPECQHHVVVGDEDVIVLHDNQPATWRDGDRVVILVHGLTGDHNTTYMVRMAHRLCRSGRRVFRLDMRGCGAGLHLAKSVFHADRHTDLLAALRHVERLCPAAPQSVVGFSLGANLTLKMLAVEQEQLPSRLDSAIVVEPPIDLSYCCAELSKGIGRFYDRFFARALWRGFSARRHTLRDAERVTTRHGPRTLYEFDERITAPLAGFRSAGEYYESASAGPHLWKIQIPTAILMANDDPIVPSRIFDRVRLSTFVQLFTVEGGGHLGFFSAANRDSGLKNRRWMDEQLMRWLEEVP